MLSVTLPESERAVLSLAQPFRRADAAALPQRVRILKWGENLGRTTGARILVDERVAQTLSANQELVAIERVPMDYEHQSVKDHPNYQPDPRLSPGAGKIEVVSGEGVYLSAIDYSSNGQLHADSYQDVSAVVHLDKDGRPLWISSVALTQTGDVSGMEFSEAVAALSARTKPAVLNSNLTPTAKKTMETPSDTPPSADINFRALLLTFLGLPAEASDEDIITASETKTAAMSATTPETTPATVPESATVAALAAITSRLDNQDRQQLVDRATREGKVIPLSAALVKETPIAVLSAIIDALPAGEVPTTVSGSREKPASKVAALSADQSAAAKALNLTEEEYRKGSPSATA